MFHKKKKKKNFFWYYLYEIYSGAVHSRFKRFQHTFALISSELLDCAATQQGNVKGVATAKREHNLQRRREQEFLRLPPVMSAWLPASTNLYINPHMLVKYSRSTRKR